MVRAILPHLIANVRHLALLLSLRLLPFATYGVARSKRTIARRALCGAAYAPVPAMAWVLGARLAVVLILLGSLYYLLLSLGANRLSGLMESGRVTRGGAFFATFAGCLLLPGALLPAAAAFTFLIAGWDLMLSIYSYCVETSSPGNMRASRGECVFFLLVNPTLLYPARGRRIELGGGGRGVGRAAAGAILLFVASSVLMPLALYLRSVGSIAVLSWRGASATAAYGMAQFLALYVAHSGLAHLQIGLMRQAGWELPERYLYPVFAKSPMDFWRRWNTYVRVWLEAYVYLPLARRAARWTRHRFGQMGAAAVTLVASGLLHDAYGFAGSQSLRQAKSLLFLAAGVLLVAWQIGGLLGHRIRALLPGSVGTAFQLATGAWSRVGTIAALLVGAAVWGQRS